MLPPQESLAVHELKIVMNAHYQPGTVGKARQDHRHLCGDGQDTILTGGIAFNLKPPGRNTSPTEVPEKRHQDATRVAREMPAGAGYRRTGIRRWSGTRLQAE